MSHIITQKYKLSVENSIHCSEARNEMGHPGQSRAEKEATVQIDV